MRRTKLLTFAIITMLVVITWSLASSAHAAPISRLPTMSEVAMGKVCFRSNTKGDFAAWYGDRDLPDVIACTKKHCGLVGSKRALASFLSGPLTRERYDAAMAPYKLDPYKDQELRAVWFDDFVQNCAHIK